MSLLDLMLLAALALALAAGSLRLPWLWLVVCDAGLAIAAWAMRFLLIIKVGDVGVAEDYLNGLTVLNTGTEIAACWLIAIVCSLLGYIGAWVMRREANGR